MFQSTQMLPALQSKHGLGKQWCTPKKAELLNSILARTAVDCGTGRMSSTATR